MSNITDILEFCHQDYINGLNEDYYDENLTVDDVIYEAALYDSEIMDMVIAKESYDAMAEMLINESNESELANLKQQLNDLYASKADANLIQRVKDKIKELESDKSDTKKSESKEPGKFKKGLISFAGGVAKDYRAHRAAVASQGGGITGELKHIGKSVLNTGKNLAHGKFTGGIRHNKSALSALGLTGLAGYGLYKGLSGGSAPAPEPSMMDNVTKYGGYAAAGASAAALGYGLYKLYQHYKNKKAEMSPAERQKAASNISNKANEIIAQAKAKGDNSTVSKIQQIKNNL